MTKVLIVDDEQRILLLLKGLLTANGYEVVTARDGLSALEFVNQTEFDIILTDVRMPNMDGLELFNHLKRMKVSAPIIFLSAFGTVDSAIDAIRHGAFDYIAKPFKVDELLATMARATEHIETMRKEAAHDEAVAESAEAESADNLKFGRLVSSSPEMNKICDVIEKVASASTTVLINGESGTGKEVVAKTIHELSRRSDKPFVAVNCAALPETLLESEMFGHVKGAFTGAASDKAGLFETANDGTLFLDEISAMPMPLQGKLLRALQEREIRRVGDTKDIKVNARIIASSNINLSDAVQSGTFRADLFYRLSVIPINLPPLRERKDDIVPLAKHFIKIECDQNGIDPPDISPEAEEKLRVYRWPGNVRELENAVRHALTFLDGDVIEPDLLPPSIANATPESEAAALRQQDDAAHGQSEQPANKPEATADSLKNFLHQKEREYLEKMLAAMGGNKEALAKKLKISLATLYRKLAND